MPRARRARSHRCAGSGIPLMSRVTLLHGFLGSPSDWAEVLALLPAGITCDCVPLRELGCRSIADAADALAKRMETRPCDLLVGYSMGGRIALELAATRPELAPRLMLLSASPGLPLAHAAEADAGHDASIEGESVRAKRMAEDDARAAEIQRDGLDAFVERWYRLPLFASFAAHPSFNATRLRRARGEAAFWAQAISVARPAARRRAGTRFPNSRRARSSPPANLTSDMLPSRVMRKYSRLRFASRMPRKQGTYSRLKRLHSVRNSSANFFHTNLTN